MITPFYQEYSTTVFCGDARQVLAELPEHSVDMVCCSPPYFGLRSYKCEPSIWACPERSRRDGDENCKHEWIPLESCSRLLSRQAKETAIIQKVGDFNAIFNTKINDISLLLVEMRRQSITGKNIPQSFSEKLATRRKTDTAMTINCPIAVKYTTNKMPEHTFRDTGVIHNEALAGNNTVSHELISQGIRKDTPPVDDIILTCPLLVNRLARCNMIPDELGEYGIFTNEANLPIIHDIPIGYHQADEVGEFRCPLCQKGIVYYPLLPTIPVVTSHTTERAEGTGVESPLPQFPFHFFATKHTLNGDGGNKTLTRAMLSTSELRRLDRERLTTSFTNLNHDTIICQKCGAIKCVLGMEPSPESETYLCPNGEVHIIGGYIQHLVGIFDLVRRVLKPTGTCFVNLGDSYAGSGKASGQSIDDVSDKQATNFASAGLKQGNIGIPAKSLIGIPARFQLAMIEHGWICRNEIVWWKRCLTGNTSIFAKSNGIPVRTSVRELYRLKKNSLELPNENGGWVKLTSIEQIGKKQVIRIILRNGFWITCTPEHRFKVNGELIESRNLTKGMILDNSAITVTDKLASVTTYEHGYFIGWFLAEGCYDHDGLYLTLSADEYDKAVELGEFAKSFFDAEYRIYKRKGECITLTIFNRTLTGFVKEYLDDKGAAQKHLSHKVWATNKDFIRGIIDGWLEGDGHYEADNNRWRLGFTYNKELADDIQTACNIIGYHVRFQLSWRTNQTGKRFLSYMGEIRKEISNHCNVKSDYEIREIGYLANPQDVYEISVDSESHLFTLPDGTITHNSCMPESVSDRFTRDFEHIFMFSAKKDYYFEQQFETPQTVNLEYEMHKASKWGHKKELTNKPNVEQYRNSEDNHSYNPLGRNARTVWFGNEPLPYRLKDNIPKEQLDWLLKTFCEPYTVPQGDVWDVTSSGTGLEHYASYPIELCRRPILAGCPEYICPKCGKPRVKMYNREILKELDDHPDCGNGQLRANGTAGGNGIQHSTLGGQQDKVKNEFIGYSDCGCLIDGKPIPLEQCVPGVVLDPFMGTASTLVMAKLLGRKSIGIDVSESYCGMATKRLRSVSVQKEL